MGPYSMDLRRRVAEAVQNQEGSLRQLARRFCVSVSSSPGSWGCARPARWPQGPEAPRRRTPPCPGRGRPTAPAPTAQGATRPDPGQVRAQRLSCGRVAVWRTLRRLRSPARRRCFMPTSATAPTSSRSGRNSVQELATIDPRQLVFVDESGANDGDDPDLRPRPAGRAGPRQRAGAMGVDDLDQRDAALGGGGAGGASRGPPTRPAFQTYVEQVLVPRIAARGRGDLGQPQAAQGQGGGRGRRAGRGTGAAAAAVESGPDPIEKMFSKVKGLLRSAAARASAALVEAMAQALESVLSPGHPGLVQFLWLGWGAGPASQRRTEGPLGPTPSQGLCATQP